jgi:hypothetical protein
VFGRHFENPGRIGFIRNYTCPLPGRHFESVVRVGFMTHATSVPCLAAILKIRGKSLVKNRTKESLFLVENAGKKSFMFISANKGPDK